MSTFRMTHRAENEFGRELKKLAPQIWRIMRPYIREDKIIGADDMERALLAYSKTITPWATAVSARMLSSVDANNRRAWTRASKKISSLLRTTLNQTPVGAVARQLHERQVTYITTLPLDAGIRAQKLAREAMLGGRRPAEIAEELARTEGITARRALLIARTETAKANSTLTQARAEYAGLTHYIWRTVDDIQVRPAHRAMEGRVCQYAEAPYVEGEGYHHPGCIYNCRCYMEPIVPENLLHGYQADVDSQIDPESGIYYAPEDKKRTKIWTRPGATPTLKSIYSTDWPTGQEPEFAKAWPAHWKQRTPEKSY